MCSAQLYARGGGSYARHPKTICRANSILARAADDGANRIEGNPARLQKAHLPGPLLASLGSDPELSEPDFARALDLGCAGCAGCLRVSIGTPAENDRVIAAVDAVFSAVKA